MPLAAQGASSAAVPERAGVHAQRVIFIDLARSLAVVFMLYGHTVTALLAPEYRTGTWYDVWQFQRGLTSSLFLLLSGFSFGLATAKRWSMHLRVSRQVLVRVRRFLLFVLLGYALHLPVTRLVELVHMTDEQRRIFLTADVLQLIGTTLIFVQALVLVTRTRLAFTVTALVLAVAVVIGTPPVWATDWTWLPHWASPYFSEATGSLFPLFPWSAYVLLGSAMGQLYGRWGAANLAAFASTALLLPGTVMLACGLAFPGLGERIAGPLPGSFIPAQFLVRAGACLMIVGAIAHGSRRLSNVPHVFGAVAQETLLIYFVHLCIVYGSVWHPGLFLIYGSTLSPLQTLAVVVIVMTAMVALAWQWNWVKHASPRAARWISVAVGAGLVLWLI